MELFGRKKPQSKKNKKGTKSRWDKDKINSKMANLNLTILIIKLNINGLDISLKGRDFQVG